MTKKQAQKLTRPQKKAIKRVLKQYNEASDYKTCAHTGRVIIHTPAALSWSSLGLYLLDPTGTSLALASLFTVGFSKFSYEYEKFLRGKEWTTSEQQKVKSSIHVKLTMNILEKDLKEAFTQVATSKATFQYKGPDKEKEIGLKMPNSDETPSEAIARLTKDIETLTPALEILDGSGAYRPPQPPDFKPKAKRLDV